MRERPAHDDPIERGIIRLFSMMTEALSTATHALLAGDAGLGQQVVDGDRRFDELVAEIDQLVWARIDESHGSAELRPLIALLLVLSEMERSADLAEHVAQRAITHLGAEMTPRSRGIVQRMSDVALEMWQAVGDAFIEGTHHGSALERVDDEMDTLFQRLTAEVEAGAMSLASSSQLTLLARFFERLGDHAVNVAARLDLAMPWV